MSEVKSIGQILNTNPLLRPTDISKSESLCSCGKYIEPITFGKIQRWPQSCKECQEIRQIRDGHRKKAARMRKSLELLLPPLFQGAHLRHLSPQLRDRMRQLQSNRGLLLYGPPGVGKSYAMCALMRHYRLKDFKVERIIYENLCLEIRDTYNTVHSERHLIKRYQEVDKLLLEDVGTTVGMGGQESDFSLRTFLLILDYRLEHCKPTFITTNKSVDELGKSFDERVASRLREACEIIPVSGRDKRRPNTKES